MALAESIAYVNGVKHGGRAIEEATPEQAAGRRYPEVDLKDGDQIVVGNTKIRVRVEAPLRCGRCGAEIGQCGSAWRKRINVRLIRCAGRREAQRIIRIDFGAGENT